MNILVAMDESRFAVRALDMALKIAKAIPGEVFILTVVPHMGVIDEISPKMRNKLKKIGNESLKTAAAITEKEGIRPQVFLEEGLSIADNIISLAKEKSIDLIVLGRRGKTTFEKFLLGSVTLQVISHAHCSVMTVK